MKHIRLILIIVLSSYSNSILFSQEVFDSSLFTFRETLYFDLNKYALVDSNITKLKTLLSRGQQKEDLLFYIEAHTDDIGSIASNIELSRKRKESVSNYLLQSGINKEKIISHYHGESKPAVNKQDALSRQLNRRVIIDVLMNQKFRYLTGQIIDPEINEGIPGTVEMHSKIAHSSTETDKDGNFKIAAPINGKSYLNFFAREYFFESRIIDPKRHKNGMKVPLKKLSVGSSITLQDLNFIGNKNILIPSSRPVLYKLSKFMELNYSTCIELSGHINSYGEPKDPKADLSIARSLIIYEELKNSGIHEERMMAKGYGDSAKLFVKPQNQKEMQDNRRVEIMIVDCDSIKTLRNDTLVNPIRFRNIVENRNYNEETLQEELKYYYHGYKSEILFQVKVLKEKGEDPSKFTYAQLLKDGQISKYGPDQVATALREIYDKDQSLRMQLKDIEEEYGYQSLEVKQHWQKINKTDSLNLVEVKMILDKRGWLGPEEVSEKGSAALFLVIQHSDLKTQLEYLPMIRKAAIRGDVNRQELALLEDRVALRRGKKQIYGSQIHRDQETGTHYIAPLLNPETVNARRATVGLGPIEEYIRNWDLDWDIELQRLKKDK